MIDAASNIRMLGDPMEMAGKPYRQFLVQRGQVHVPKRKPGNAISPKCPFIAWVEAIPHRTVILSNGVTVDCQWFTVSEESARHWISRTPGNRIVICECQGRFLE